MMTLPGLDVSVSNKTMLEDVIESVETGVNSGVCNGEGILVVSTVVENPTPDS